MKQPIYLPGKLPIQRSGARISQQTQDAMHQARDSAKATLQKTCDTCGCPECSNHLDALATLEDATGEQRTTRGMIYRSAKQPVYDAMDLYDYLAGVDSPDDGEEDTSDQDDEEGPGDPDLSPDAVDAPGTAKQMSKLPASTNPIYTPGRVNQATIMRNTPPHVVLARAAAAMHSTPYQPRKRR